MACWQHYTAYIGPIMAQYRADAGVRTMLGRSLAAVHALIGQHRTDYGALIGPTLGR